MKVAITSASGKLGSAITKHLSEELGGDKVIGIARTVEKARHLGIEIRKGDYNSRPQLDKALKGVDVVLLVSGMDAPEKRIQQHRNVIDAARQNGVKKIVYTSIVGDTDGNAFSPIVKSNRQTEKDIIASGLNWVIGRNGIYIEPDLEYLDTYVQEGEIRNCAGKGKCGYTSRPELAAAYTQMLLNHKHNGKTYNLVGKAISQLELANCLNQIYGTALSFNSVSVEAYKEERISALGEFMGTVIAGIYEGIRKGVNNVNSDFERAAGRQHSSVLEMIKDYKSKN